MKMLRMLISTCSCHLTVKCGIELQKPLGSAFNRLFNGVYDSTRNLKLDSQGQAFAEFLPICNFRMEPGSDLAQAQSVSAFVIGGTGEVGKELVKALAASPSFSHLVLVGRRQLDLHLPPDQNQKVEQRVVDFERLGDYSDAFQGCDMGFCALGTTRAKAGQEGFVRVDHDYVVQAAKLAKEAGCRQFHLVSAQGANKNGWLLYPRTKGLAEEHVGEVGFERLSVYRPALLLCERDEQRRLEGWAQNLAKRFDTSNRFSVNTATVARAMVRNALRPGDRAVEVLENGDIINLGFAEGN